VIFVDWEKGAAGPGYALAAANTQLIGRQLAILISEMVTLNSDPEKIHMIGFSLGAHVAGFAGKALKLIDIRVGRITGGSSICLIGIISRFSGNKLKCIEMYGSNSLPSVQKVTRRVT